MSIGTDFDKFLNHLRCIRRIYERSQIAENGRLMYFDQDLTDSEIQGVTRVLVSIEALKPCGRSFKASVWSGFDANDNRTYKHKVLSNEELITYMNTGLVDNRIPDRIYPVNKYEVLLPTYEDFVNKYKGEILAVLEK